MALRLVSWLVDIVLLSGTPPNAFGGNPVAGKANDGLHQAAGWLLMALLKAHVTPPYFTFCIIATVSWNACCVADRRGLASMRGTSGRHQSFAA
jgi:hypothetical protein